MNKTSHYFWTLLTCMILGQWTPLKAQINCADLAEGSYVLCEDFSDGDISNNPTWSGDTDAWIIEEGRLRSNASAEQDFTQLTASMTEISDITWEFYVEMDFNPSSNNLVDVYLMSDDADLTGMGNGYFVRIGSSKDNVSLYRKDAGVEEVLIEGVDDAVDVDGVEIKVKVSRSASGEWTLERDQGLTGVFVGEGSISDQTYTNSSYFGWKIKYSSTRTDKFYFDDIYIGQLVEDVTAPEVTSVSAINANQILVEFSEAPTAVTALDPANYTITGGINPSDVVFDENDPTAVILTFANTLPSSGSLEVSDVSDAANNVMTTASFSFSFISAGVNDIIINEIFPDPNPTQGLPEIEYVELFNRTNNDIALGGWGFSKKYPEIDFEFPNVSIPANGYLVLCKEGDEDNFAEFGNVLGLWTSGSYLTNGGADLSLSDASGTLINAVSYSSAWYRDSDKADGGYSLELINPDNLCGTADNWIASQAAIGGTPGTANSVLGLFPDNEAPKVSSFSLVDNTVEIIFDEGIDQATAAIASNYTIDNGLSIDNIIPSPSSVILFLSDFPMAGINYTITINGLQDCVGNTASDLSISIAVPEPADPFDVLIHEIYADIEPRDPNPYLDLPATKFIELFNHSEKTISLAGWTFSDASKASELGGFLLSPGGYVILCKDGDQALFSSRGIPVLGVASFPEPNTTSDELSILDDEGTLIHSVNYTKDWYQNDVKKEGGWTLEMIDPNAPCSGMNNWAASEDITGGTPGRQNSIFGENPDIEAPKVLGVSLEGTEVIEITFNETLDAATATDINNYSIDNGISINTIIDDGNNSYSIFLSQALAEGIVYTLTINGVSDCVGNTTDNVQVAVGLALPADPYDVVINEIYADTEPLEGFEVETLDLPDAKFVELYNRSDKTINLSNWFIIDGKPDTAVLTGYLLLPDAYVILCSDNDVDAFVERNIPVLGVDGFPTLNTSGEMVRIVDEEDEVIHNVYYDKSAYQDIVKQEGGWTIEMVDPNQPCMGLDNWRASLDSTGGTPGKVNSVMGENPDTTPLELARAEVLTSSTVKLIFGEPVDILTASNPSFYTIEGMGNPTSVRVLEPEYFTVLLTLPQSTVEGEIYTVTVGNEVTDCAGNAINTETSTVNFGETSDADVGDIVINEILSNPVSGGEDFVELYNNSDKVIDLSKWLIASADPEENPDSANRIFPISLEKFSIFPGQYLVLADWDVTITNSGLNVSVGGGINSIMEQYGLCGAGTKRDYLPVLLPSMPDQEGIIIIRDILGTIEMDRVWYKADWHHAIVDDLNGVSLERIDPNGPSNDANNWHSAAAASCYATPAYLNSQNYVAAPSEQTVTLEPKVFSPDSDGFQDFLNIQYAFDEPGYTSNIYIFDERGREVMHLVKNQLAGREGIYKWGGETNDGTKANIGVYVVVVEIFKLDGTVEQIRETCVVAGQL